MQKQMIGILLIGCIIGNVFPMEHQVVKKQMEKRVRSFSDNDEDKFIGLDRVNTLQGVHIYHSVTKEDFTLDEVKFLCRQGARLDIKNDQEDDIYKHGLRFIGQSPAMGRFARGESKTDLHNPEVSRYLHGKLVEAALKKIAAPDDFDSNEPFEV